MLTLAEHAEVGRLLFSLAVILAVPATVMTFRGYT